MLNYIVTHYIVTHIYSNSKFVKINILPYAPWTSQIIEFSKIASLRRTVYPEPWQSKLDDFQKIVVLKCLRADKVTNAMQLYLAKHLGQEFIEPQTAELSAIYNESSPTTPIVFILSTGTDPAAELYKFADKLKMTTKLHAISLGQGQGPRAEALLKLSAEQGYWCFFQV